MPSSALSYTPSAVVELSVIKTMQDMEDACELLAEFCQHIVNDHHFNDDGIQSDIENQLSDYRQTGSAFVLARVDGMAAGCLAVRPLNGEIGEVKRMYVRPNFRGLNLGRLLIDAMEREAHLCGYKALYLSSLHSFTFAHKLYFAAGYHTIAPYNDYPPERAGFFGKTFR